MRISTDAEPADIAPAVNWISGLIGAAIDKRFAAFEQQERANPLLMLHYRETFALEFALAKARKYMRATGRLPKGDEYHWLYSFLVPARRIHAALPLGSKKPFEGRLRNAVDNPYGARPFAYEISIASHLMQKGWDVEFADYAGTARFDLLARLGPAEIELECKTTSGDTGRKIHAQEANRLAQHLLPATQRLADVRGCHRILVTIPDRLGKSNDDIANLAAAVTSAALQRASVSNDFANADYMFDGLDPWPEPAEDPELANSFFGKRFGKQNATLLFNGQTGFSVVAVMLVSAKADSVVKSISEEAKKAAEQCSGTRAAIIAINLVDQISRSDLQAMLETSNGMHQIMHAVVKDGSRPHVDTLAFTFPQTKRSDGQGATWLSGNVIALYNPQPLFSCPEIRSIFRRRQ